MIQETYKKYYLYLEELRQSGRTNMFGAAAYLQAQFKMDKQMSYDVLSNWMQNYQEISEKYYKGRK